MAGVDVTRSDEEAPRAATGKALTIGAVVKQLEREFPDISISKIRYLEDQKLLSPRRTRGGYRLYTPHDVQRLRTIVTLQRDEFLPLRVIRQELASPAARDRKRRRAAGLTGEEAELDLQELCQRAGIDARLARELEEFGLLAPRTQAGERRYSELEADIAHACGRLAHYGIAPRHLRAFRTAADREAGLIEQVAGPALRARSPERRRAGMEDLEALGELAAELSQLLAWRALRRLAST